jgi:hypothetical protein
MCINCVIRQEKEEDEKCAPPNIRDIELILRVFFRRKQGLKNGNEGQESPADSPEATQEDPSEDERRVEVVEPHEEPDPSARDEFHQAYTKTLQAADKDVEEYARTLDSVSYPVSARMLLSPQQSPHTSSSLLGLVIFGHHPPSHRLRIRTLLNECVPR